MRRTRFKAKRKDPAKVAAWRDVKASLWVRCQGHCEVPWCQQEANDAHHVQKRSQGGLDTLNNLVALCRAHHDATDYASGHGRLTIVAHERLAPAPRGYGFGFFILYHPDFGNPHVHRIGPFTDEDTP